MEHTRPKAVGQLEVRPYTMEPDEGIRLAQGRFLDELPGAVFALITLVWVISCFAGLIWRDTPADIIAHLQSFARSAMGSDTMAVVTRVGGMARIAKTVCAFMGPRSSA